MSGMGAHVKESGNVAPIGRDWKVVLAGVSTIPERSKVLQGSIRFQSMWATIKAVSAKSGK